MRNPIITTAPWMWADGWGSKEDRKKIGLDLFFFTLSLSWGRLTWGIVLSIWPGNYRVTQVSIGKVRYSTPGIQVGRWSIEDEFPPWKWEVRWPVAA